MEELFHVPLIIVKAHAIHTMFWMGLLENVDGIWEVENVIKETLAWFNLRD